MRWSIKRYLLQTSLLISILITTAQGWHVHAQQKSEFVVVIDPGHGGTDPGAIGGNIKEKDITLAIALKLGRQLSTIENTRVIYTRETDVNVPLYKRAQIANDNKADLFISIHCNSVNSSRPYGAETWVMGLHRSKANLEVARKENSVILLEDDYETRYEGFDPNSPEAEIIFSLYQNAYLDQSVEVASLIQQELRTTAQRFDRGVKQAGFLVLWRINMPGILVEAGFLSNENERKYLTSDAGQNSIATSIFQAILQYRERIEGRRPNVIAQIDTVKKTPVKPAGSDNKPPAPQPNISTTHAIKPASESPQPPPQETNKTPNLYYSVQFLSTSLQRDLNDPVFQGMAQVHSYTTNGLHRYVSGVFNTLEEAVQHKNQLQQGVFQDAFVVAFYKGERISLSEAANHAKQRR